MEELGKAPKSYLHELGGNNGIGSRAIVIHGNEGQKKKYLPKLASGEMASAFALTEPNAGSDAGAIETFAR